MRKVPIAAVSAALILMLATSAFALEVPAFKGYVNDMAGMMSPATRQALEARLAELDRTDSTQVAVLTVPSLDGDDINLFSIRVADAWKVGQKGSDNGVIFLVSKADRKMWIEVGKGLQGVLTDVLAGQIVDNVIAPKFKAGDFDGGFMDGVAAISGAVRGEFTAPAKAERRSSRRGVLPLLVIPMIVFIAFTEMFGKRRRRGQVTSGKGLKHHPHGSGLGSTASTLLLFSMLSGGHRGGGFGDGDGGGFGGFGGGGFDGGGAGGDW